MGLLSRHRLVAVALTVGAALRICDSLAYRPALLFSDSFNYISHAQQLSPELLRPVGYSFFLWPFVHGLPASTAYAIVAGVQHAIGLGLAVLIYAFGRRKGLPAWGATLATLPVLLDPLQLVLEEYVLSDVLFETLLTVAFIVLLWSRRPGWKAVVAAGLMLGLACLDRDAGIAVILVALIALLFLRAGWRKPVGLLAAFAVPLVLYAGWYDSAKGRFALQGDGARYLYARIEPFVDCHGVTLTPVEAQLCPRAPVGHRLTTNQVMWDHLTAQWHLRLAPGQSATSVIGDFDRKVILAHPWGLIRASATDTLSVFAPVRTENHPSFLASTWLFHPYYWSLERFFRTGVIAPSRAPHVSAGRTEAAIMTAWGRHVWTPGPLLALAALAGLLPTLAIGRSRTSNLRTVPVTLSCAALVAVLTATTLSGPSWRYQIPQLSLLPIAAATGISSLFQRRSGRKPVPSPALTASDAAASASSV